MSDEQLSKLVERMAQSKGVDISPDLIGEAVKRVMAVLSGGSGACRATSGNGLDPRRDYPLAQKRPDLVRTATGLSLDEISLDKVEAGKINFGDMKIRPGDSRISGTNRRRLRTAPARQQYPQGCGDDSHSRRACSGDLRGAAALPFDQERAARYRE